MRFEHNFSSMRSARLTASFILAGLVYLSLTTSGSSFVVKQWLLYTGEAGAIDVLKAKGNLFSSLEWQGVSIGKIKRIPSASRATAEKAVLSRLLTGHFQVALTKARVESAASEPVGIEGTYSSGIFDAHITGRMIRYEELAKVFPFFQRWDMGGGLFSNVDLKVKGSPGHFTIAGSFLPRNFMRKGFLLKSAQIVLNAVAEKREGAFNLSGQAQAMNLTVVPVSIHGCQITAGQMEMFSQHGIQNDVEINVTSGKVRFQDSEMILFSGRYAKDSLNFNVYSKWVAVEQILALLKAGGKWRGVEGTLTDVDMDVTGAAFNPRIAGAFHIEKLTRSGFSLKNAPGTLNLQARGVPKIRELYGSVILNAGEIQGPKTATVQLKEGRILFNGTPVTPGMDFKGNCLVGGTKIDISLKGLVNKPDVKLQSKPPLPQEQLMVMMLTNKRWISAEKSLTEKRISPELARDFVDYFLFDDMGSKLSERLGISEFSITFEKEKKGFGVKKSVIGSLDATYAAEQTVTKEGQTTMVQKVGGEYKVTDNISVGAEREVKQEDKENPTLPKTPPADKVMIKFQKEF